MNTSGEPESHIGSIESIPDVAEVNTSHDVVEVNTSREVAEVDSDFSLSFTRSA